MEKLSKILLLLLIIISIVLAYVLISDYDVTKTIKEEEMFGPIVTGSNISVYKNSCGEFNVSQVSKDPRLLINKKVKIKGEIKRKGEITQFNKDQTQLELYVPGLSPTPYIIVTYGTTTPYNVGDIIEVYGEYNYPIPLGEQVKNLPPEISNKCPVELSNKDAIQIKAAYIQKA
jgi:hypothetical protein